VTAVPAPLLEYRAAMARGDVFGMDRAAERYWKMHKVQLARRAASVSCASALRILSGAR